jgi:tetratricopeptide (TPR) repeat protein
MATEKPRRLVDITEPVEPAEEDRRAAEAEGATIVGYDPNRVEDFVLGRITLGELEGITKDDQYEMAKLGHAYIEQGKLDLARNVFRGLNVLDPYDAYFQTALGTIAQREGELETAEEHYSRALEINPYSTAALANRGEVRLQLGRLEESVEDLLKAVEVDPEGNEPGTHRAGVLAISVREQLEQAGLEAEE